MTNTDIRRAARTICTGSYTARLAWLRANAPEIAADVEAKAARLLPRKSAEFPRTAMQQFSRLVDRSRGCR